MTTTAFCSPIASIAAIPAEQTTMSPVAAIPKSWTKAIATIAKQQAAIPAIGTVGIAVSAVSDKKASAYKCCSCV